MEEDQKVKIGLRSYISRKQRDWIKRLRSLVKESIKSRATEKY